MLYFIGKKQKDWFGKHNEREAYEALLRSDPTNEESLRKALLRRAMTDIRRLWNIHEEKDSVYNLMRSGAISEEMWGEFKQSENELNLELYDLQAEAETFKEGWSESILKEAAELVKREEMIGKLKKARELEDKKSKEEKKRLAKQKEHEERTRKEQDEKARRMTEKYLSS